MAALRPGTARSAHKAETTYVFEGALTGVDANAGTFTVAVEEGNKAARTYPGEQACAIEDGYTKVGMGEVEEKDLADPVVQQARCRPRPALPNGSLRRGERRSC